MQTQNKSSARQAALDLHYTYIDIPEESSSELADYITDYFHRHKFNTSKVKKQIKELAELPCVKDEYTAVASARNVLNTHISRLNECPGLLTSDFSDYLGLSTKKSGRPGLNENNSLVGLKDEQEKLTNAVNSLILEQSRRKLGLPDTNTGCNLVFAGSPGTAKTTLARVFAKSLAENGLIPSAENFKECRKSDIVGMYVGHTAAMVDRLFEEMHRAGGGVIFFDEIYTLSEDNNTCFDKEAINCITQNMENYRTTVYCIFAGYKNKMKQFINANPGLSSRISETIIFEDYSDSTLCSIFENMLAAQSFTVEGEHEKYLRKFFSRLREEKGESFGNGREARNLFEASKRIMAARVVPGKARSKAALSTIMPEEIKAAGDSLLSSVLGNEDMPVIGF